ncbi:recombinase family protein [Herbaspirillum huttiense]|uniref:recombinase family protein n=1 Tax=Herbaspirillum huttiense TaxID=863372 RepID=UPI003812BA51
MKVGYIRVSTVDQNTNRQLEGVKLDKTFTDKASAKNTTRPALQEMLGFVREGDQVYAHSIDRLARNLIDLRTLINQLTGKGISVTFVKEGLTFSGEANPINTLMLSMMGAFAEFERELIKERQREGIASAKRVGKHLGRARSLSETDVAVIRERVASGANKSDLAKEFKVSRATLYKALANKNA